MKLFMWLALALVSAAPAQVPAPTEAAAAPAEAPARIRVVVAGGRYEPATVTVREGEPVRLTFLREEWSSCTAQVVFPTLGLTRDLPPGEPVEIDLPALPVGETPFRCAMNMVHGTIVVEPK